METKQINWANDFKINEMLHTTAQELMGVFGRLCFHNPSDVRYEQWKTRGLYWADYEDRIKDLVIDTQAAGEKEVEKISQELKSMLALEKDLLRAAGKIR